MPPPENSLPIGHDLEIIDDENDEVDDATITTQHTHGHNITSRVSSAWR